MLWEAVENRKGAVKPRPLCTPLGLFLGVLGLWGCDTVLTFVCMLRYWMWNVVPRLLQWNCNEVLDVQCTSAEFRSPCGVYGQISAIYVVIRPGLRSLCGIYGRVSAVYAAYTARPTQSILCNNISYRNIQSSVEIYFGSVLNCQYRSIQTQVNIFQHSTVAALYKKGPGVCRGARPCAPLRFSHIPMWIYPLRASAVHVTYSNISYRNIQSSVEIYFGSVLNCQYRSIQTQVNIFQHSTVAALYKKGPGVCRGARPCAPLRFSHIPMWIYPLRASAVHVAYSREP